MIRTWDEERLEPKEGWNQGQGEVRTRDKERLEPGMMSG